MRPPSSLQSGAPSECCDRTDILVVFRSDRQECLSYQNTRNRMSRSIPILIAVLIFAGGCESLDTTGKQITGFFGRLGDTARGRTPRNAAVKMEDQYFPDERREGINELVKRDFGKREPYTKRYDQIAKFDDDWLVRATAIRALNRARDRSAGPTFIAAL